jgi:hypothetical protein
MRDRVASRARQAKRPKKTIPPSPFRMGSCAINAMTTDMMAMAVRKKAQNPSMTIQTLLAMRNVIAWEVGMRKAHGDADVLGS